MPGNPFTRFSLDALLGSTTDAVAAVDAELRTVFSNDAGRELYRRATGRELVFGMPITARWEEPARSRYEALYRRALAGESFVVELELAGQGAPSVLASVRFSPIRSPEGVVGVVVVGRDVTAQRRAESALRRIARGVVSATGEEFFQKLVASLTEVLGVQVAYVARFGADGLVRSVAVQEGAAPGQAFARPQADTPCAEMWSQPGRVCFATRCDVACELTQCWRSVREHAGIALLDSRGEPIGSLAVGHDAPFDDPAHVTDVLEIFATRAAAELERQAQLESLRCGERLEAVARLAGGIAHDFNNLLTIIQATAATELEELPPGTPLAQSFSDIRDASDSAANIVLQLSALARAQAVSAEPTDLRASIARLEGVLRRLAGPAAELELVLGDEPAIAHTDGRQLERVVVNLVKNARDALPHGGRIAVVLRRAAQGIELSVSDSGTGIAPDVLPHIFEPFFSTKAADQGTGLGLACTYGIVRQLGGTITVESEPGRGTTFRVRLPAASNEPATDGARDTEPPPPSSVTTVLVLEDDAAQRSLASVLLRRSGYRVVTAADGAEAQRVMLAQPVDVLLADVVLPGSSGPAVAAELTTRHPALATLYMSGYSEAVLSDHGLAQGSAGFIAKPFTRTALAAAVQAARARVA
ncbi:MAG: response regulator [Polyangiaceae bacterium]|nr:response regulator [Polyangiaceae bacterium]